MFQANMIEQILFNYKRKVGVELFTDSKPLLDSIASTKQVKIKMMRPVIADMKEKLIDGSINSFKWIGTSRMVADVLTKDKKDSKELNDILTNNKYEGIEEENNKVIFNGVKVKMERLHEPSSEVKKKGYMSRLLRLRRKVT